MEEKKTIKLKLFTVIILFIIFILLIIALVMIGINKYKGSEESHNGNTVNPSIVPEQKDEDVKKKYSEDIDIVASLEDEITTNCAWCGTFQLVWNDMINNVVKCDVKFINGNNLEFAQKIADNLDKQTFTEKELSEKDYYKVYDLKTLELKEKIEKTIKEKFNETSDVLGDIDWSKAPKDNSGYNDKDEKIYIFYTMLKKVFNFENDFDELENGTFGTKYKDIKYFGINEDSNYKLYSQVEVLYYNSETDFAVILNTKEGEQVILARGLIGNKFSSLYNNLLEKTNKFKGNNKFTKNDYLKVPNINLNKKREYTELCEKRFLNASDNECYISKAIQTIQLDMNKSGGKIKSEAIIEMYETTTAFDPNPVTYRYFYFNDEFTMFLKEKNKDLPYFAANIEDITLFQN